MSAMHIQNKESFHKEVLNSDKPVLLDFFASWCGPCRMVSPVLDQIASERPDIKVCKVDIDEHPELAWEYQIRTVPTLLVIEDGEVQNRSSGVKPKGKILEMLS